MSGQSREQWARNFAARLKDVLTTQESNLLDRDQPPKIRGLAITLCTLSSAVLWFMFSMQGTYTQFFDFPTSLQNVPPEQALAGLPPSSVRVQIEGRGVQLLRLYYTPPTVVLDAAESPIDLTAAVAEITGNVRMESVIPDRLELQVEPRVARLIPVRPRVTMGTEPGYHVVGVEQVSPDSVTVSGARSIIESLRSWPTETAVLEEVRGTQSLVLALADSLPDLVTLDATSVNWRVDVKHFTEATRQVEIIVEGAPDGPDITFDPASTSVRFQVPLDQYDQALTAPDFYATVQYEDIRTDTTGTVYADVHLPAGFIIREARLATEAFGYYFNVPQRP